jgi:preprotein translocase subunit SecF
VCIGTYSSLFIAAPILYYVRPRQRAAARAGEEPRVGARRAR